MQNRKQYFVRKEIWRTSQLEYFSYELVAAYKLVLSMTVLFPNGGYDLLPKSDPIVILGSKGGFLGKMDT
jgi:hypothetical protein